METGNHTVVNLYDRLKEDVRFIEGMKACFNCGTCTAICPAAEFYNYDPRLIVDIVQSKNEEEIENLLKSDMIWYCGECMSCKTRCPRGNAPGLIIMALRSLSQDMGYFTESEKGRQQLAIKRTIGDSIIHHGYCMYLEGVGTDTHPEQGPVWDWIQQNYKEVMRRMGANYKGDGPGILRKIPEESMKEIRSIFEVTGGMDRYRMIEGKSSEKALELGWEFDDTKECEYYQHVWRDNDKKHFNS
jgi:heterodisulfide reductase subunit C